MRRREGRPEKPSREGPGHGTVEQGCQVAVGGRAVREVIEERPLESRGRSSRRERDREARRDARPRFRPPAAKIRVVETERPIRGAHLAHDVAGHRPHRSRSRATERGHGSGVHEHIRQGKRVGSRGDRRVRTHRRD